MHDTEKSSASVVDSSSGQELFSAHTMDSIWVELAADSSAAHGPKLRIRLVSSQHPAVQQASIKAAYPQRTEGHQVPSAMGGLSSRQSVLQHTLHGGADTSRQQPDLHDRSGSFDESVSSGKQSLAGVGDLEGIIQDAQRQKLAALSLQKPRPGRKATKPGAELKSIAAVLDTMDTSMQAVSLQDIGKMPACELGTTAEFGHCAEQLVSCVASPCVVLLEHAARRQLLQAFWQLQLRIAKKSARADAALSLASSDRMAKLQCEMCDLSSEMKNLQKQLQNA